MKEKMVWVENPSHCLSCLLPQYKIRVCHHATGMPTMPVVQSPTMENVSHTQKRKGR